MLQPTRWSSAFEILRRRQQRREEEQQFALERRAGDDARPREGDREPTGRGDGHVEQSHEDRPVA